MSAFIGADVAALRLLAVQLSSSADELESLVGRLSGRVNSAQWRGPDSDRFRGDWSQRYTGMIRNAASALRSASEAARTNAGQQETASAAVSGLGASERGVPLSQQQIDESIERIKATGANSLTAMDVGRLVAGLLKTPSGATELTEVLPRLGKVLGPIGLALGASDVGQNFAKGEYLKGAVDLLPEVVGTTDWTASMLGATGALGSSTSRSRSRLTSRTMLMQWGQGMSLGVAWTPIT
jgi:uncharacterized protein YukE